MKIYKIDVSRRKDNFNSIYDVLDKLGNYIVYPSTFVLISRDNDNEKENLAFLSEQQDISMSEVNDIKKEIANEYVRSWIYESIAKIEVENSKKEIQERTEALYDILAEANKKIKEDEAKANGKQEKLQKTTKQKSESSKG